MASGFRSGLDASTVPGTKEGVTKNRVTWNNSPKSSSQRITWAGPRGAGRRGQESPLRTVLLKLPALSFATDIAHLLGNVPPASCALDCVSVWNRVRESTGSRTEKRRFAQEKQGAFLFLDHNTCHAGSQFPKQGLNPCSLHWKLGVPTTGVSSVA